MFTSIYALKWVIGAKIWLIGCIICLIIAFVAAFSIKTNRKRPNCIIDVVWFLMYFPNGEYVNMGLASASGLLLYPFILALGVTIVSMINNDHTKER